MLLRFGGGDPQGERQALPIIKNGAAGTACEPRGERDIERERLVIRINKQNRINAQKET
jgi:hypothetical protein